MEDWTAISRARRQTNEKSHSAYYDPGVKTVTVNTARKPGVHYGEIFEPGQNGNMSAATMDRADRSAWTEELRKTQNTSRQAAASPLSSSYRKKPAWFLTTAGLSADLAKLFVRRKADDFAGAGLEQIARDSSARGRSRPKKRVDLRCVGRRLPAKHTPQLANVWTSRGSSAGSLSGVGHRDSASSRNTGLDTASRGGV